MKGLGRIRAGAACLALILCASVASAQTTPTLTGNVTGLTVELSWTAVPGATGYDLLVAVGGTPLAPIPVGNQTSLTVPNTPPGSYQLAVRATAGSIVGPPSNVVTLNVALVPPAAPTNLSAGISGNDLLLTWDVNTTDLTALFLQAGSASGASDIGTFPLAIGNSLSVNGVPGGNYFFRLFAVGAGGSSPASSELAVAIPGCVAPAVLPLNVRSNGTFVQMSWPAVPGATGYRLDVSSTLGGGPDLASVPFDAATTSFSLLGAPLGTYYLTLHTTLGCGPSASSAETVLTVTPPVRQPPMSEAGARAMVLQAVNAMAAQFPGDLRNSCGNNTWMFRVLQYLRQRDNRFGLNWKRGHIGDLSQDVISYIFDDAPEELADQHHIYMWDIIIGHCGPNPGVWAAPNWSFNIPERWTIEPYLRAGFAP